MPLLPTQQRDENRDQNKIILVMVAIKTALVPLGHDAGYSEIRIQSLWT